MKPAISEPRKEVGKYAPKIIQMQIDPQKIGDVVGQRGKTINALIERTDVKIDITDDGNVSICGEDAEKMAEAKRLIEVITTVSMKDRFLKEKLSISKNLEHLLNLHREKRAWFIFQKLQKRELTILKMFLH